MAKKTRNAIDLNDPLTAAVFNLYCDWLNSMRSPGELEDHTYTPADFADPRWSSVVISRNDEWGTATFTAYDGDDGGPAKLFVSYNAHDDGSYTIDGIAQEFDTTMDMIYHSDPKHEGYKTRYALSNILKRVDQLMYDGETDHWEICNNVADHFKLYGYDDRFPIWLSRVVEGRMRNFGTKENEVD